MVTDDLLVDGLAQIVQGPDDVRYGSGGPLALDVRAALEQVVLAGSRGDRVRLVAAPRPRRAGRLMEPTLHLGVHLFQERAGLFRPGRRGVLQHQRGGRQPLFRSRPEAFGKRAEVGRRRRVRFDAVARTNAHQQFLVALRRRSICNVRPRDTIIYYVPDSYAKCNFFKRDYAIPTTESGSCRKSFDYETSHSIFSLLIPVVNTFLGHLGGFIF